MNESLDKIKAALREAGFMLACTVNPHCPPLIVLSERTGLYYPVPEEMCANHMDDPELWVTVCREADKGQSQVSTGRTV